MSALFKAPAVGSGVVANAPNFAASTVHFDPLGLGDLLTPCFGKSGLLPNATLPVS